VVKAIAETKLDTLVGPIAWGHGPVKNVAKTPLVGGQWRRTPEGPFKYDLVITSNSIARQVAAGGPMQPIV
jgi:branched-chain amino acid transport system substrate-binding protein